MTATVDLPASARDEATPAGAGRAAWMLAVLLALAAAQAFGVLTSPPDRDMGHLQKIMYVHVPAAWTAFIAFGVVYNSARIALSDAADGRTRVPLPDGPDPESVPADRDWRCDPEPDSSCPTP